MASSGPNPFHGLVKSLTVEGTEYRYYDLTNLNDPRYDRLPYSVRVLLEAAVRNCDDFHVKRSDVENILDWEKNQHDERGVEVAFKPARVILQDFTGVPAVVDFAAMRDAVKNLGGDPDRINPICPSDLVIDHSVQVDFSRTNIHPSPNPGGGDTASLASPQPILTETSPLPSPRGMYRHRSPHRGYPPRGRSPWRRSPLSADFSPIRSPFMESPFYPVGPPLLMPRRFPSPRRRTSVDEIPRISQTYSTPCSCEETELRPSVVPADMAAVNAALPIADSTCPFHQNRSQWSDALEKNQDLEFERNKERFVFLKWGAKAFRNMLIVPPGSGIVHQVNLEYLARVVFVGEQNILYPDSLVGTDSHTTMINGLGVVGWGVGGIEAEAVMLGQAISMVLPKVVGYKLTGKLSPLATSTDLVLTITKHLRQIGVVGKFVEFFGSGVTELSIADRATISNMCPEYGATIGYFPVDEKSIDYLRQTGRDTDKLNYIESYLRAVRQFRDYGNESEDPIFSEIVELNLATVVSSVSGPKRPHDRVAVSDMKVDFLQCLSNKVGFKGYGLPDDKQTTVLPFTFEGKEYNLRHGSVVIAAITSCTNTSNPSVMLGAGLLAQKAVEKGLSVLPYIKTSLSPGSGVVTYYLQASGVTPYLEKLGFDIVGYGCMTCIGNSGPLPEPVVDAIEKGDLVAVGVLSGNRNFEGRIHPNTRANYLASPLLVIAYALAGRVDIDFEIEPIGQGKAGEPVYLRDVWPSRADIQAVEKQFVIPAMFKEVYSKVQYGNPKWSGLEAPESTLYPWDETSTYIKSPPFFEGMQRELPPSPKIENARVLLNLGDSVTTDHISPAGSIARNSAAARYLSGRGLTPRDFNSYGARRGNDAVMARGTFANIRLVNKFMKKPGPQTVYLPSGDEMDIFDAAERYKADNIPVIVLAGKEYGSGSSRDWAAKGPFLLGIKAVIAESYERIHRSNLVGMGIVPLQYKQGENATSLNLTGKEKFTIDIPDDLKPGQTLTVKMDDDRSFDVLCRFDTEPELSYFRNGGILNYMIRKMI